MTSKTKNDTQDVPKIRFPEFGDKWIIKKLEDVSEVKGGKRIPKGFSLQSKKTDYPYITISDMGDGTVNLDNIKYVPDAVIDKIKRYTISSSDIYISVAGTLGLVGTIPSELDGANLTENADKLTSLRCDKQFLFQMLSQAL